MHDLQYRGLLTAFPGTKILVIGDVMLDEYVWGEVRRISPEAPVPVVECKGRYYAAGGAGNVANNVAGLAGQAMLGGVVGNDHSAYHLREVLAKCNVNGDGLLVDTDRPTTTKTRILAHSQQVVRVDSEARHSLDDVQHRALMQWVADHIASAGCCVLSDYSKGLVSHALAQDVIALARDHHKPVVVDPKGTDYTKYRGASVITPNVAEAERATNLEIRCEADVLAVGNRLLELLEGSAVLLTRGSEGMSLLADGYSPYHIPTVARSVYDVTGAGDTVVSTLSLAMATGLSLKIAAELANRAAGIVVGKLGTARVSLEELESGVPTNVPNDQFGIADTIRTRETLHR
jgi:D-beta-D-heptose 7-phosphate kinase/D-beta-D-heptose 1-phosphate adenosyltransferase